MTFAARHEGTLHRLFLIRVWVKGASGLLETAAGLATYFVTPTLLENVVIFLTAPELSEDPDDWLANHLHGAISAYTTDTQGFLAAYLILHGVTRMFLVGGMLWSKLWAYPLSLFALALFILYQGYRFVHTHSFWLILLTVVDLAVAYLIWDEYQVRRLALGEKRGP